MQYNDKKTRHIKTYIGEEPVVYAQTLPYGRYDEEQDYIYDESNPFVFNINRETLMNDIFKHAIWTGDNMQVSLMSIQPRSGTSLEMHPDSDEFLCFLQGQGNLIIGEDQYTTRFRTNVNDNYIAIIPAGMWHRLTNTGIIPLKLYVVSAAGRPRTFTGF